tara:strand:- start:54 stop:1034 length:981 start_codon:yes stop_codon:yes gene_type:complete
MAEKRLRRTQNTFSDDPRTNRAEIMRRDNDRVKTQAITIYDIDYAVMSYIEEVIQPKLIENGKLIDVPVMFASGEKYVQIQSRGFMRDQKGKIMTPLISLRRSNIVERDTIKSLGVNENPSGMGIVHANKFSIKNQYDKFNVLRGTKPAREYYVSPIPEYLDVSYEMLIWCEYTEQLNKLIEQLLPLSGFAWGTTWKFISLIGDASFETLNNTGEDRIVRATIPITTKGVLLAESELRMDNFQKQISVKKVTFKSETEQFDVDVTNEPPGGYDNSTEYKTSADEQTAKPFQEDVNFNPENETQIPNQTNRIRSISGIQDLNNRNHE